MPSTFNLSNYAANYIAGTNSVNVMINAATMTVYDGGQPANADTGLGGGNHALGTFTFPASGANSVGATGIITFGAIADNVWAVGGTASFVRVTSGANTLFDASVGLAGATPDIVIDANPVVAGAVGHIVTSPTYTVTH